MVNGDGGFKTIEQVFSRIYLENYDKANVLYENQVTGNLWSIF
jgi:hypothetical protein